MKKFILLTAAIGLVSFTSCEKTAEGVKDGVKATGEGIERGAEGVAKGVEDVAHGAEHVATETGNAMKGAYEDAKAFVTDAPNIADNELQNWANKLHDEAVKAKASATTGNQDELNEAMGEMKVLHTELEKHAGKPGYDEAQAYYKEVKAELEGM